MTISFLNIQSTLVRTLESSGRNFVVHDDADVKFMSAILDPQRVGKSTDGSPRTSPSYVLSIRPFPLGPLPTLFKAGHRVSLTRKTRLGWDIDTYELLADPETLQPGGFDEGFQTTIQKISVLYPYAGTLRTQGSTNIISVPFALWSQREGHQDTGTYEDFLGEAPIEFADRVAPNKSLWVGDERYRVVASTTDLEGPRVTFTARRANG